MAHIKVMNHSEYQKKVKYLSDDVLKHIIEDCREVIKLQSSFNPNCGYYADEIHYCSAELNRRKKAVSV